MVERRGTIRLPVSPVATRRRMRAPSVRKSPPFALVTHHFPLATKTDTEPVEWQAYMRFPLSLSKGELG